MKNIYLCHHPTPNFYGTFMKPGNNEVSRTKFLGCGIKDGLRADGNFRMTDVADPRYLIDSSVPADWYLEFPLKKCADFFELPYTGVINRPDLQEILLDECRQLKPDFMVNSAAVTSYQQTEQGVTVSFGDGSSVDADVLVAVGFWTSA